MMKYPDSSPPLLKHNAEPSFGRETLVVEFVPEEAVGTDENANQRVKAFLQEMSDTLELDPVNEPKTHISPKYGLSGWVPLEDQSAIHFYAWDRYDAGHESNPPFASVDFSTPQPIRDPDGLKDQIRDYFRVIEMVSKTSKEAETFRDLAPQVLRQRLSVSGLVELPLADDQMRKYMKDLCGVLDMSGISEPIVSNNTAWMHWETSGTVASWNDDQFSTDIYTCKPFRIQDAVEHARSKLRLKSILSMEF